MKLFTRVLSTLSILGLLSAPAGTFAEDIDIFTGLSGSSAGKPNILFVLDNTSNWARASQKWPGGLNQGQAEVRAIKSLVNESNVSNNVNFCRETATTWRFPYTHEVERCSLSLKL